MANAKDKKLRIPTQKYRIPLLRKNGAYDGQVPATLVGAIVGMLLGIVPAAAWAFIFKSGAFLLYAVPPLAMYCFIRLLKGCRDVRAVIITAALTLLGTYLMSLNVEAAIYARSLGMSLLSVPLVAVSSIGDPGLLPSDASGYVFPLLFAALGLITALQLMLSGSGPPVQDIPDDTGIGE